jgi:hypothetical protein
MIIELEDSIVSILRTRFDGSGPIVEPTVDDVSTYDSLGARGCVLVRYIGESYTPQTGNLHVRTWRFMVMFGSKHFGRRTSDAGIYQLMDSARGILSGARIQADARTNPIKLTPEAGGFIREQSGVWWYYLTFSGRDSVVIP